MKCGISAQPHSSKWKIQRLFHRRTLFLYFPLPRELQCGRMYRKMMNSWCGEKLICCSPLSLDDRHTAAGTGIQMKWHRRLIYTLRQTASHLQIYVIYCIYYPCDFFLVLGENLTLDALEAEMLLLLFLDFLQTFQCLCEINIESFIHCVMPDLNFY